MNPSFIDLILLSFIFMPILSVSADNGPPDEPRPWQLSHDVPAASVFPETLIFPGLTGVQTNGQFSGTIEQVTSDYKGPPTICYKTALTLIMIEGELLVRVSGTDMTLKTGQWLHIPPGNPNSYKSTGAPARFVLLQSPADPTDDTDPESLLPAELLADPAAALKYLEENLPDFHPVPEHGFPGDPQ